MEGPILRLSVCVKQHREHASTAAVYGAFDLAKSPSAPPAVSFEGMGALEAREHLFNHLEPAALGLFEELAAWRRALAMPARAKRPGPSTASSAQARPISGGSAPSKAAWSASFPHPKNLPPLLPAR